MLAGGEDKVAILDAGTQFAKVCNYKLRSCIIYCYLA